MVPFFESEWAIGIDVFWLSPFVTRSVNCPLRNRAESPHTVNEWRKTDSGWGCDFDSLGINSLDLDIFSLAFAGVEVASPGNEVGIDISIGRSGRGVETTNNAINDIISGDHANVALVVFDFFDRIRVLVIVNPRNVIR